MKMYDVKCPVCGAVNKGLYLEETRGWMICEKCKNESMQYDIARQYSQKVPLLTKENIADIRRRETRIVSEIRERDKGGTVCRMETV